MHCSHFVGFLSHAGFLLQIPRQAAGFPSCLFPFLEWLVLFCSTFCFLYKLYICVALAFSMSVHFGLFFLLFWMVMSTLGKQGCRWLRSTRCSTLPVLLWCWDTALGTGMKEFREENEALKESFSSYIFNLLWCLVIGSMQLFAQSSVISGCLSCYV